MNSSRNIAVTFFILSFNSFVLSQVTDSHGGDFVVVTGTTTYESLPFIETFLNEDGPGQEFNSWVSAQWGNSYTSTTDDYDCVASPCTGNDEYVSFLTPPDSFMLQPPNNTSVNVWKYYNSAPSWSDDPVAYFAYSYMRNYSTSMYSPLLNISDFSDLKISFDMHFDAWAGTSTNEYLYIEYCTGSGWENALTFLADSELGAVNIPWGNNSFFLTDLRDLDTLQIRFRTHGTFAYNLNYWYVDNVSIQHTVQHDDVSLSVSDIDVDLIYGESDTVEVVITNIGDSDVDWSVEIDVTTGGGVTFTKSDYADWTDETNQDRVSDNLWITRCDTYALFNAYYQGCADDNGPEGTQWAIGSLSDGVENLYFGDFIEVLGYNVGDVLNDNLIPNNLPMVMHDTNEDLYYEVQFHSWTEGGAGGGFSYTRGATTAGWIHLSGLDDHVTFTKSNYADWTEEINQDRVSDSLWITSCLLYTSPSPRDRG